MNAWRLFGLVAPMQICSMLVAQAIDVSPYKQREQLVAEAQKVFAERGSAPVLPDPLPNPFIEKPLPDSEPDSGIAAQGAVQPEGPTPIDLLMKVSSRIAATGTANLGGQFYLLAGQKKFKVGDKLTVDYDGLPYELVITSITSTGFTLKKGDLTYTRAIRLQTNTSTPASRP